VLWSPKVQRNIGLLGGALGVVGSLSSIIGLPPTILPWIAAPSGTLLIAWLGLVWIRKRRQERMEQRIAKRLAQITARYATVDDVDKLWEFLFECYHRREDHVINRESLRDFVSINARTAKMFMRGDTIVGAFIVFAINTDAVRKLLAETITSAQQLSRRYAVRLRPAGLYITNVCGRDAFSQENAKRTMKNDLKDFINSGHGTVRYLFGRMANKDGARILRATGFEKINEAGPDQQVWKKFVGPKITDDDDSDLG
jgi:hypothetical protein